MSKKVLYFFLILLLQPFSAFTQSAEEYAFIEVDSTSRTIKYKNDIYKLTNELINSYTTDILKARAIFIWITENIKYDYKFYNKGKEPKTPKCKSGMNCQELKREWEKKYIDKVLKKKKGVCAGYAMLFKKMCDIAGVKSEIIPGYTKTKPYHIGITGPVNHAWNAVWLDSGFYFLDATWAAGYCKEDETTGKLLNYTKSFTEYYWLTPFDDLAKNHYPSEAKWVYERNYTKQKFADNPFYDNSIISQIKILSPSSGVIEAKVGDTIFFKFDYLGYVNLLQINSNVFRNPDVFKMEKISKRKHVIVKDTLALKKQQYVHFTTNGNRHEFYYVVHNASLYYLDILFDYNRVLRFKVKIIKESANESL